MASNPESLTPDAALLEAERWLTYAIASKADMTMVRNLAVSLRAALDREREMQKQIDRLQIVRDDCVRSEVETLKRAEQAERERDALAVRAEAQREAFALVEQEARRRAEAEPCAGFDSAEDAYDSLAEFCRLQREGS